MVEYKDVSYKEVLCKYENTNFYYLCKFNNVKNLEDVYNLYKNYDGKEKTMLDRDFHEMQKRLNVTNRQGGYPDVYKLKPYSDEKLKYNDLKNKGDILLFDTPTTLNKSHDYDDVKKMRMDIIKYDMSYSMINGQNYLRFICNRIGSNKLPIIQNAINMYTDQIERQALLTHNRDINLFTYDIDERKRIISDNIRDIISYLINNTTDKLVWGELNEFRRNRYVSSINYDFKPDIIMREIIANYVSNYVTIEEASDISKGDNKALKRFIIK